MDRYFFNHRAGNGEVEIDIDGLLLPSLNTAVEEASFAARAALTLAEEPSTGVFEIEDAGRTLVARVPYALKDDTAEG